MRVLTNLLFKVTVSSMVLTAPAMINGNPNSGGTLLDREAASPCASSAVIKNYIDHLKIWPVRAYVERKSMVMSFAYVKAAEKSVAAEKVAAPVAAVAPAAPAEGKVGVHEGENAVVTGVVKGGAAVAKEVVAVKGVAVGSKAVVGAKAAELRRVISESEYIYVSMKLANSGLSEMAFEYAWRGYHNLLKKGTIHKRTVLSIVDFSQSSSEKRMYVIDLRHRRLLYRTYVAHGQNSGAEYAETFSNEPESFKSSLGFYVTRTTYVGKNGLSLRLNGVDLGYNDQAMKRNIVLHGCTYVGDEYLANFGATGTSLGCPALPSTISAQIIQTVKGGSCLFIYHPTQDYLDHSTVINE